MPRRATAFVASVAMLATGLLVTLAPSPVAAAMSQRWRVEVPGAKFHWSSPVIADVNNDGSNDVAVGGTNGSLYVRNASGGELWTRGLPSEVNSSPAVGDVDGDGSNEIVVGYGAINPSPGGIRVFDGAGNERCTFAAPPRSDGLAGVFNSPAIGDINGDGINDIVFGSFNDRIYAVNGACGKLAEFDNTDTVWSAPALREIDGDGEMEILVGGDATASSVGLAHSGGYFRAFDYDGRQTLQQKWVRLSTETFQGTAAFAVIDGRVAVVSNAGSDYCRNQGGRCGDSNRLWVFDAATGADIPGWTDKRLDTGHWSFLSGPAVGDVDGDGRDDVIIGGNRPGGGQLRAFLGSGGSWTFNSPDEIVAQPVIAEVTGGGGPEVLIGTNGQIFTLRGSDGAVIDQGTAAGDWAHKSAVAVGNLGGAWSMVTAGFDPGTNTGKLGAFAIPAPPGNNPGPWPMFQKNARRVASNPADSPGIRCTKDGYYLSASDGGIFTFGPEAPFYGSAGNIRLNAPIVDMTARTDRTGYWFVATDGGIFNYGSARFFGSTGNLRLNRPIVGMAARPQGDGYWLVASDGGIFSFGGATFEGSTGAMTLNSPIVGMAATPSGNGYWLVAADGGVFAFGDATFYGSTGDIRLNQPIVGMAASRSGNGYWFVARDGGIFSFGDAKFFGSTGDIRLNQPIVGMRATPSGNGYWFVATDGGIFSFGDAQFCRSMGNRFLNQPIVGMG
jgi:ribosomal protein L24E